MAYKLAIFDFDGTLADSFPWFLRVADQIAVRYGFTRMDHTRVESLRALPMQQLLREHNVSAWKLPFIVRHARALMAREIGNIALFAGVPEMLQHLVDAGVTLAMLSSNSQDNVMTVLGKSGALFSQVSCGASLFGKAPKVRRLLKTCRVSPDQAILIGDEIRDGAAARTAGIAFGAVTWGYTRADVMADAKPHMLFQRVDDMRAIAG